MSLGLLQVCFHPKLTALRHSGDCAVACTQQINYHKYSGSSTRVLSSQLGHPMWTGHPHFQSHKKINKVTTLKKGKRSLQKYNDKKYVKKRERERHLPGYRE